MRKPLPPRNECTGCFAPTRFLVLTRIFPQFKVMSYGKHLSQHCGADHIGQFQHHPSASSAVIVRKVVVHHLFLNIIPSNFPARTERKVWCVRGMYVQECTIDSLLRGHCCLVTLLETSMNPVQNYGKAYYVVLGLERFGLKSMLSNYSRRPAAD